MEGRGGTWRIFGGKRHSSSSGSSASYLRTEMKGSV